MAKNATANVVVLKPPPVEQGEAPISIKKITTKYEAGLSLNADISKVAIPQVLAENEVKNACSQDNDGIVTVSAPDFPQDEFFAVIDNPDYTDEEKKVIFSKFVLPKVLKRMSMREEECEILPEALDEVISRYSDTSGIRNLEQAAEHIAANALYQIEVNHVNKVVFDKKMVRELLG